MAHRIALLRGERVVHSSAANAVISPAEFDLPPFPAGQLLPLVGLAGREAIGGRLFVTNLRLAFVAHAVNRVTGTLSVLLPDIREAIPWRSRAVRGLTVRTDEATFEFVSWSRKRALDASQKAGSEFGPAQAERTAELRAALRCLE